MNLQTSNQVIDEESLPIGLYLHVPFCSTSCDFCGFYQIQSDRKGVLSYIDGIAREIKLTDTGNRKLDTMFWGGGTPGLLPAKDISKLAKLITDAYGKPTTEWTVEMAPSSVKKDKLAALKDAGVTRISMGLQSLDESMLAALGRQHSRKQALTAYELIRSYDFDSVNLDLIFAIPGQTEEQWRADLRAAMALEPDHLSTYCLTFEEDTALYVKLQGGQVSIDLEREEQFYRVSWEESATAGFEQYEVSNYAKPGHACIHNLNTWRMGEWIGLGPSAASQFQGFRYSNTPDLQTWLEDLEKGNRGAIERIELRPQLLFEDSLIFGLRMNEGVDLALLEKRFGLHISNESYAVFAQLEDEGKLERVDSLIRLTAEGRLVADAVGELVLDTQLFS